MAIRGETTLDLLCGLIALQLGIIDDDQLVSAFRQWSLEKTRPISEIFVERADIDLEARSLLEAMARKQLEIHGGDSLKSLTRTGAGQATLRNLIAVGDAEITESLAAAPYPSTRPDPNHGASIDWPSATQPGGGQRFRVLRPHASGGLGAVFVALDGELNREVAFKQILDRHADDPISRGRFLIEAEITGRLEHPGIVPVYGLGRDDDGRPYYAMRFIRGDSLKEAIAGFHADESFRDDPGRRSLALRELLRRFVDVCNAVDYAHGRGVIHRDLKPGNVIVGKHGETLVVDWGLAKPLGRSEHETLSDERTLILSSTSGNEMTIPGAALGTPAYMSPEQADGDLERLGPRSDVYSLGATLYCLLTGRAPFDGIDVGAVLFAVRRGDFRAPRHVDPSIDRALEAVCLKAMATNPEDRYASCRALADDVDRWAADEPVTARAEPFVDRTRRWMRRRRASVTAAVASLAVATVGLAVVLWVQANANERLRESNGLLSFSVRRETQANADLKAAQSATQAALIESERARKQAEAISGLLTRTFRSPDPSQDGRQVKVADLLDRAVEGLNQEFDGAPETRGALLEALGETYYGLGLYDTAVSVLEKARDLRASSLGPEHPLTLESRQNIAATHLSAGRLDVAIPLIVADLAALTTRLGRDDPRTLDCLTNLGLAYLFDGRTVEAVSLLEEALGRITRSLGEDHTLAMTCRNNLAMAYESAGRLKDALIAHEQTLAGLNRKFGPDHHDTLSSRNNIAVVELALGRVPEALARVEGLLPRARRVLGADHPDTLTFTVRTAEVYERVGRWEAAETLRRDQIERRRKHVPTGDIDFARDLAGLGQNLLARSMWSEAEPPLREALAIRSRFLPGDWTCYDLTSKLGVSMLGQGNYVEAEPLLLSGYEGLNARLSSIPPSMIHRPAEAGSQVPRLYRAWGRPERATAWERSNGFLELPDDPFRR